MKVRRELCEPVPVRTEMGAVEKADELLETTPMDANHLSFEELRTIGRALRKGRPEGITDEELAEIMLAVYKITLTLLRVVRWLERGHAKKLKL